MVVCKCGGTRTRNDRLHLLVRHVSHFKRHPTALSRLKEEYAVFQKISEEKPRLFSSVFVGNFGEAMVCSYLTNG